MNGAGIHVAGRPWRTDLLLQGPLGAAFIAHAAHSGLPLDVLARPDVAFALAYRAARDVDPWSSGRDRAIRQARDLAATHRPLADRLASAMETAWFSEPFATAGQEWLGGRDDPDPTFSVPMDPPDAWERYAHRPARRVESSTSRTGGSSLLHAGDPASPGDRCHHPPVRRLRLVAAPTARIVEVDGPADWHALCAAHPAVCTDRSRPGILGALVPDWSSVARVADIVHLTFFGWLTSTDRRWEGPEGFAVQWAFDGEMALWLRDVTTGRSTLPAGDAPDEPAVLANGPFLMLDDGGAPLRRVRRLRHRRG